MSRLAKTLLFSALFVVLIAVGQTEVVSGQSQISAIWRGISECTINNSPCQDEANVYRFSEVAARPGWFFGNGSKVVNGEGVSMGTLEWQYDPKSHILQSENPNGVFRLVLEGDQM